MTPVLQLIHSNIHCIISLYLHCFIWRSIS